MGVLQDSLLDGGRVVTETPSSASLPQPPSPSPPPLLKSHAQSYPPPTFPAISEEPHSQPWAMPYLSQLAGFQD